MTEFLVGLFLWVSLQMGVDPKTIELPTFVGVTPQEMSIATCGVVDPRCPITPALYDGENLYYIADLEYAKNREYTSFIIHHIAHYIQFIKAGKDPKVFVERLDEYEKQALELQRIYITIIKTDLK